jgi:hypothetical protein
MTQQTEPSRMGGNTSLARRELSPRIDRMSSEVWFADYPFRRDPKAVLGQRASLIAFLGRHQISAVADDELPYSPAIQLSSTAQLDQVEALLADWVGEADQAPAAAADDVPGPLTGRKGHHVPRPG